MVATTVLLVDDDDRLRSIVRTVLEDDGLEIVADLDDGKDAVRLVDQLRPDVVLLDMMLPSQPGLAVADAIRKIRPDQAIVLFSSLLDPKIERMAVAHGLTYLEKCDGIEALEGAIARALGRRERQLDRAEQPVLVH